MIWHGEYKVPGGKLVVSDFDIQNGKIANYQLTGDFFLEPASLLDELVEAVTGIDANSSITEIAAIIRAKILTDRGLIGITPEAIGTSIRRALTNAATWRDYEWEIIQDAPVSPFMNSALDEVLTQEVGAGRRNPTLRIWASSAPAIYIGSFQSVRNEVDVPQATAHGVEIVRRISGGGAMFMVPENSITYALHLPETLVRGMSFEDSYAFLDEWVIEALQQLGIDAKYMPLNDITGPNGKIGGAAQKRLGAGGILHHVTIAYDMDAEMLTKVLRIGREKMSDKGTKSSEKRVDPLKTQTGLSREEIIEHMVKVFRLRHGGTDSTVTAAEMAAAEKLAAEKFNNDEWRYRIP